MSAPAVVLGGQVSGLAVTRSLGARGVPVAVLDPDPDAPSFSSRFATSSHVIPDPRSDEDKALARLVAIGRRARARCVLVATGDHWARTVADHRDELSEYFIVPSANGATVRSLLDKRKLFQLAQRANVSTPRTVDLAGSTPSEAIMHVGMPALVKPAEKSDFVERYGRAALAVFGEDDLRTRLTELGTRHVVLQQYLPPEESGLQTAAVFIDRQGEVAATFGGRRLALYPPEFGTSALVESKIDEECAVLAVALLREAGYRGLAEVEFMRDGARGAWNLIDVNPRCWKWIGLTSRAGVDMPWMLYLDAVGEPLPRPAQSEGVKWVSFLDLMRVPSPAGREKLTTEQWSMLMRGVPAGDLVDAVIADDDMKPWGTMLGRDWASSGIACAC